MPTDELLIFGAYAVVFALILFPVAYPLLGILQQEGYATRALVRWYFRRGNGLRKRYFVLTTVLVLATALLALVFSFAGERLARLVSAAGYLGALVLFYASFRRALKVPLAKTNRILRLSVAFYVFLALILFGVQTALYALAAAIGTALARLLLLSVPLSLFPMLLVFVLSAANLVMKGYETPRNRRFISRGKQIIAGSGCVKVGITGSYAKTSVKHFAAAMLSTKYRVSATPLSYNTPIGIARFVNENGLDCEIFLAEMGARNTGDIAELCDMVCPDIGVVTGIAPQHLESFGTLEAIAKEKGVLAERTERGVLGITASSLAKEGTLVEGVDFSAEDVVLTREGTRFTLRVGKDRAEVFTPLLGRHSAEDLAIASALCSLLGMTFKEIVAAIPAAKEIPHRLQRMDNGSVTILDDSYNSNVAGARDAVETLRLFGGKRYVVTPGLVELGELEEEANRALGALLPGCEVILVGETLVLSVRQGYLDAGGDDGRLRIVPTLKKAQEILAAELQAGDAVLFLNDLPDKYL